MGKYGEQLEKNVGLIQRLQAPKGARLVLYGGLCSLYMFIFYMLMRKLGEYG
jgi:hypothetical protein